MNIQLPPDQQKWLEEQVKAGRFASLDEAIAAAVDDLRVSQIDDDLSWAKPYIDEALAQVRRGEVISGREFFERMQAKLSRLRSR
jgi:Arc/MetJ-type ribon-helix-helix transcriptional regulator